VSFSSLKDAYTTSMDVQVNNNNNYKRPDVFSQILSSSEQAAVKPFSVEYEHFGNVGNVDLESQLRMADEITSQEDYESPDITCDDIIGHVSECEYCRQQLNISTDPLGIPEYLQNTILYIIMGIFILFLLDMFVKLGKSLN